MYTVNLNFHQTLYAVLAYPCFDDAQELLTHGMFLANIIRARLAHDPQIHCALCYEWYVPGHHLRSMSAPMRHAGIPHYTHTSTIQTGQCICAFWELKGMPKLVYICILNLVKPLLSGRLLITSTQNTKISDQYILPTFPLDFGRLASGWLGTWTEWQTPPGTIVVHEKSA